MFKRYAAALAALSLLASIPAQADYAIKDGNAASQTFGSFSLSGVQFPKHVMVDPTTGAAIGVSGAPLFADTVVRAASADRGGTVATGGTAQVFMAANTNRRGFVFQNQSTGDLYVNCLSTAAASQSSLRIPAGALYETPSHHSGVGACSVFGATTGQAFYAREF